MQLFVQTGSGCVAVYLLGSTLRRISGLQKLCMATHTISAARMPVAHEGGCTAELGDAARHVRFLHCAPCITEPQLLGATETALAVLKEQSCWLFASLTAARTSASPVGGHQHALSRSVSVCCEQLFLSLL